MSSLEESAIMKAKSSSIQLTAGNSKRETKPSSRSIPYLDGFDRKYLKKAIAALTQYIKRERKEDSDLLYTKGEFLCLQFELTKIPPCNNSKPFGM